MLTNETYEYLPGTYLRKGNDFIKITSKYNKKEKHYEYICVDYTENGTLKDTPFSGYASAVDIKDYEKISVKYSEK